MTSNPYSLSSYHFDLPKELIAQRPVYPKDSSRLLVVYKETGHMEEIPFSEIKNLLQPKDLLVFNNTKVIPARLLGKKKTGAQIEILLLEEIEEGKWKALAKPGKKLQVGEVVEIDPQFLATVEEVLEDGSRVFTFSGSISFKEGLYRFGKMPLPPYMERAAEEKDDLDYQTVYAEKEGAVAAPTAGLHFTKELLESLSQKGIFQEKLTLHVGAGTFLPVKAEDIRQHTMHLEKIIIPSEVATFINNKNSYKKLVAVGTTSLRALEGASDENGKLMEGETSTNIFIYPGYSFKQVDALLTNFHLPGSSLLMLVSAFLGYDLTKEVYRKAVKERFRFFSYGDAMIIL